METTITFKPAGKTFKVRPGTTVLLAAQQNRIHIPTRCSGMASCLMCKIQVEAEHAAALSAATQAERRKLGPLLQKGIRLACQAKIDGQAVVSLPEDRLKTVVRKLLEAQQNEDDSLW
ncbi:ferredoxin [Paenibacillus yonginensis]|uniref:Ferredoxin n=1 Tax=Paenibacillus yonginensis TaxID=1462996 RepID=A0A1B1N0C8_9BACL|nr:2Fe-2S iron-sulfur cluster-binding protein [Paenibacillus yonginensis]ANS74869.1 ferredoxin [Paenibacillus yonginensis]